MRYAILQNQAVFSRRVQLCPSGDLPAAGHGHFDRRPCGFHSRLWLKPAINHPQVITIDAINHPQRIGLLFAFSQCLKCLTTLNHQYQFIMYFFWHDIKVYDSLTTTGRHMLVCQLFVLQGRYPSMSADLTSVLSPSGSFTPCRKLYSDVFGVSYNIPYNRCNPISIRQIRWSTTYLCGFRIKVRVPGQSSGILRTQPLSVSRTEPYPNIALLLVATFACNSMSRGFFKGREQSIRASECLNLTKAQRGNITKHHHENRNYMQQVGFSLLKQPNFGDTHYYPFTVSSFRKFLFQLLCRLDWRGAALGQALRRARQGAENSSVRWRALKHTMFAPTDAHQNLDWYKRCRNQVFFFHAFSLSAIAGQAPIEEASPRSPRAKLEKKKSFRRGQEMSGEMMVLWVMVHSIGISGMIHGKTRIHRGMYHQAEWEHTGIRDTWMLIGDILIATCLSYTPFYCASR